MKLKVATAVCVDTSIEDEKVIYPQLGSISSYKRAEIYFKCATCMFSTLTKIYPECSKVLVTNAAESISKEIKDLLSYYKVDVVNLNFKIFRSPIANDWKNAFYKLDAITYLGSLDDCYYNIFLDNDTIWTSKSEELEYFIKRDIPLAYNIYEQTAWNNNRQQLEVFFTNLGLTCSPSVFDYYGGEFLAGNSQYFSEIALTAKKVFDKALNNPDMLKVCLCDQDEQKCILDADEYPLSYSINSNKQRLGVYDNAKFIIQRYWTRAIPKHYQPLPESLFQYPIWHLPNEKNNGFQDLYNLISADYSYLYKMASKDYFKFIAKIMCIHAITPSLKSRVKQFIKKLIMLQTFR